MADKEFVYVFAGQVATDFPGPRLQGVYEPGDEITLDAPLDDPHFASANPAAEKAARALERERKRAARKAAAGEEPAAEDSSDDGAEASGDAGETGSEV